jgi:hypothetical protein
MKNYLRSKISKIASYFEIFLGFLILAAIVLASIKLCTLLINCGSKVDDFSFQNFLGFVMALIIAVEFVKMLSRHTPGSAIEVLVFAMARKLIIAEKSSAIDLLLGIIAIAVLFFVRKYLFVENFDPAVSSRPQPPETCQNKVLNPSEVKTENAIQSK